MTAITALGTILTRSTMTRPISAARVGSPARLTRTDPRHVVEVANWRILREVRDRWKDLATRAAEPNVFYDPDFALPAIEALGHVEQIRAVLVWRGAPPAEGRCLRRLIGVFPYLERCRWGLPAVVAEAFIHPYAMSSAPLVDPDHSAEAFGVLFDWLAAGARYTPDAWLFGYMPGDGAAAAALARAAASRDIVVAGFDGHERAVLETTGTEAATPDNAASPRARKEYRRQRRRLGELGHVETTDATDPTAIAAAIEEFLALEASGWKGRAGTAAAQSPAAAGMFRDIAASLSAGGGIRVDALRLDGRAIAMTISLIEGSNRWLWKIAYDEDFAQYSPGVLLTLDVTDRALAAGEPLSYDSCALPRHPMIDRIWRQRRRYADLLVVPGRHGSFTLNAMTRLEGLLRGGKRELRRLRAAVTGR